MGQGGETAGRSARGPGVRRQQGQQGAIEKAFILGSGGRGDERFQPRGGPRSFRVEAHDGGENFGAVAAGGAKDGGSHVVLIQPAPGEVSQGTAGAWVVPFTQRKRELADDEEGRIIGQGEQAREKPTAIRIIVPGRTCGSDQVFAEANSLAAHPFVSV